MAILYSGIMTGYNSHAITENHAFPNYDNTPGQIAAFTIQLR